MEGSWRWCASITSSASPAMSRRWPSLISITGSGIRQNPAADHRRSAAAAAESWPAGSGLTAGLGQIYSCSRCRMKTNCRRCSCAPDCAASRCLKSVPLPAEAAGSNAFAVYDPRSAGSCLDYRSAQADDPLRERSLSFSPPVSSCSVSPVNRATVARRPLCSIATAMRCASSFRPS